MNDLKQFILSFTIITITGIGFSACSDDNDNSTSSVGVLKDSILEGVEYRCGDNQSITNSDGQFTYIDGCEEIDFFIGGIKLGTVATNDINISNGTIVYPADLLSIDRNNTTNSSLVNTIQILQTLDDDNNPYNGIKITEDTRIALNDLSLDLSSDNITQSDLDEIATKIDKTLINRDYAISHYEDTLRKDINSTVRTVAPAPAIYSAENQPTNLDSTMVYISGASNTKIFVNGEDINKTIDDSNVAYVALDTSGGDGEITNIITLRDVDNQESDEFNAILIKDTVAPVLEIEDVTIDENSDENITVSASDSFPIKYSLGGVDANSFNIDPSTGIINFKNIPDYENKKSYSIDIIATDTAGNSSLKLMNISINHLNDEVPNVSPLDIFVEEGMITPINLGVIDLDQDENQTFVYTITGGEDAQFFSVNGNLSFNKYLTDQTPEDMNGDNIYKVNITINDGVNLSKDLPLSIKITPKNENAPIITSPLSIDIDEHFLGTVYTTTYTDADNMPQNFTFNIDGDDSIYFEIDHSTGIIKILTPLVYDEKQSYIFNLSVNDGVNTTTKQITINLTRVFVNSTPVISKFDSDTLRVAKGEKTTFNYSVSDENENQSLTCSFDFNGDGITDNKVLNCTSGQIEYIFQTAGSYTPILNVSDGIDTISDTNLNLKIEDGYGTITGNIGDYFTDDDIYDATIKLLYNGQEYKTISADTNGYYSFDNVLSGDYQIIFDYSGYIEVDGSATVGSGISSTYQKVQMVPDGVEAGVLQCNIKNAVTGSSINGATVKIYSGFNTTSTLISTQNLSTSNFDTSLNAGYYTLVIQKDGYIDATYSISIGSNKTTFKDLIISPTIGDSEIRVVLSWGYSPSDLDSHMTKVKDGINIYHLYYGNHSVSEGSLDTDDTSSYGPETITLRNMDVSENTEYHYYVHNYSGYTADGLSNSNAKVEIYYGNQTYTAYIPSGYGHSWKVFDINNGQISICHDDCILDTSYYYRNIDKFGNNELDIFNNLPTK